MIMMTRPDPPAVIMPLLAVTSLPAVTSSPWPYAGVLSTRSCPLRQQVAGGREGKGVVGVLPSSD